jgi:hypothetical protein
VDRARIVQTRINSSKINVALPAAEKNSRAISRSSAALLTQTRTIWKTSGNALKYWLLIILNPPQTGGFFMRSTTD